MTWTQNYRAAAIYQQRQRPARDFQPVGLLDAQQYIQQGLGVESMDEPAVDAAIAELLDYLASTGEKIDDQFVYDDEDERGSLNIGLAIVWAFRTYGREADRTFEFVRDMVVRATGRGLSAGQIRGLLNCMRAEALREARAIAAADPFGDDEQAASEAGEFAPVVETMQRLAASLKWPKVRLADDVVLSIAGQRARFPGSINVLTTTRYGEGGYHGRVNLDGTTTVQRDDVLDLLRRFAQDPESALATYGRLTGHCAICGRLLENEESVARGIGPVCAGKAGL
jgi:hypothetical protein